MSNWPGGLAAVLTGRYLRLPDTESALTTAAASLVYAVPLWWRNRSALQHLTAFGAAVAVLETGIDRIDPRAGTFAFGIALWVFALAWGLAASRGHLHPAPVGMLMHQVPLIGLGAVGTLYVVPDAATRYLPGSVAAPLAVAVVGLVLLGVALWLARQRRKETAGHTARWLSQESRSSGER